MLVYYNQSHTWQTSFLKNYNNNKNNQVQICMQQQLHLQLHITTIIFKVYWIAGTL